MVLILSSGVFAINLRVTPIKMTLKMDPTENQATRESFILKNSNEYSVDVELTSSNEERIILGQTSFVMAAGEEKETFFDVIITEEGTFDESILVGFEHEDEKFAMPIRIKVLSEKGILDDQKEDTEGGISAVMGGAVSNVFGSKGVSGTGVLVLVFVVLVIVVISLVSFRKRRRVMED